MEATDGEGHDHEPLPKSVRQKQILDVAAEQPDASFETIAKEVPSATVDLVERVLEEYGDPAAVAGEDDPAAVADEDDPAETDPGVPGLSDLTDKQRETLHTIYEHPDATQRELAALLDVSAATISNRVNNIEGFEWDERRSIAETLFETSGHESEESTRTEETQESDIQIVTSDEATANWTSHGAASNGVDSNGTVSNETSRETSLDEAGSNGTTDDRGTLEEMASAEVEFATAIDRLEERVAAVEEQIDGCPAAAGIETRLAETELVHKVLHACFGSDTISEDEELQLLDALLQES